MIITNADGATSQIGLTGAAVGTDFTSLLDERSGALFQSMMMTLRSAIRAGPISVKIGTVDQRRPYLLYVGRLPDEREHTYVVLSRAHGSFPEADIEPRQNVSAFFASLQSLLTEAHGASLDLKVTAMEARGAGTHSEKDLEALQTQLAACSLGGSHAAHLGNGRFAMVHDAGDTELSIDRLVDSVRDSLGLDLSVTSIDPRDNGALGEDGARAVMHCLRRFADHEEGFDIDGLAKACRDGLGEVSSKIRELRRVVTEGDFSLVYQPIVWLSDRSPHHFEALARMHDNAIGDSPYEAIVFAERVGLITDIDTAVMTATIDRLKAGRQLGAPPSIAVNLSARSLASRRFVACLLEMLESNRSLSRHLMLEITETTYLEDLSATKQIVDAVRSLGFKVCLDDFGAGASGFRYLRDLSVDIVKIDGAYIRDALIEPRIQAFLRAMVVLCQDLGIETVGEWVETEAQAKLLQDLGVTYGQGFLFGRPQISTTVTKARARTPA